MITTMKIQLANAPCSWGVLEFEPTGEAAGYAQVLDEMAQTGYAGTELGPWGFMPTDPNVLRAELAKRHLTLVGAFVPVALGQGAHARGESTAVRTAHLLAACSEEKSGRPFIVLSDENGTDPARTQFAGCIRAEHGLSRERFLLFAEGAQQIAWAVKHQTGLRTVFHPHCAGFVETPEEIETFLSLTDPELIGLCFDTGHYTYGGGNALEGFKCHADRIWHLHFKDCHPAIAEQARAEGWDYFQAVQKGVFCELGEGEVDFPHIVAELKRRSYEGWIVVEQDLLPGTGSPQDSAQRNRNYLRNLGL